MMSRKEAWASPTAAAKTAPQRSPPRKAGDRELSKEATSTLFVYDVDSSISPDDLEEGLRGLFGVFGIVTKVAALPGWRDSMQALVTFSKTDSAVQAMSKLQGFSVWGRPLRLAFASEESTSTSSPGRPSTAPAQRGAAAGYGARPSTAPSGQRLGRVEPAFERGAAGNQFPEGEGSTSQAGEVSEEEGATADDTDGSEWGDRQHRQRNQKQQQQQQQQGDEGESDFGEAEENELAALATLIREGRAAGLGADDPDLMGAMAMFKELEQMLGERDEQLERMRNAESALRELEEQRDMLRRELAAAEMQGVPGSSFSADASAIAALTDSMASSSSSPSRRMAPAPSAGADEQQHRAPARGTQIVDDVGAVVPSEGARGSRIPPELEELEGMDIEQLAQMLGDDPEVRQKLSQLEQMMEVAQHMRELDALMGSLQGAGTEGEEGELAEQALALAAERLRHIESTLEGLPGGGGVGRLGGVEEGDEEEEDEEEDEEEGEKGREGGEYEGEPFESETGSEAFAEMMEDGEGRGGVEEEEEEEQNEDGARDGGEGGAIDEHLEQELEELHALQDRILYLKQLLSETKEQQRLLEEEGYEGGDTGGDTAADTAAETETENEPDGRREFSDIEEQDDSIGQLDRHLFERPPSQLQSDRRAGSRLSWADEDGGRKYLEEVEMPRPVSRTGASPSGRNSAMSNAPSTTPSDNARLDADLQRSELAAQDLRTARMFTASIQDPSERKKFISDFLGYFIPERTKSVPPSPLQRPGSENGSMPSPDASRWARGSTEQGAVEEDLSPLFLLRELQGVTGRQARLQILNHIRSLQGRGSKGVSSSVESSDASARSSRSSSPRARGAPNGARQGPARGKDSGIVGGGGERDGSGRVGSTPQKQGGTPQRASASPSGVTRPSPAKPSPYRHNYFMKHLEDDAESPNKPIDDQRPAFDSEDDDGAELESLGNIVRSTNNDAKLGNSYDYSESVSSSQMEESEGNEGSQKGWSNRPDAVLSSHSDGSDGSADEESSPYETGEMTKWEAFKKMGGMGEGLRLEIEREVMRCLGSMVARKRGQGSARMSEDDATVLTRLVRRMVEERGKPVDALLQSAIDKRTRLFLGKDIGPASEEISSAVAGIVFQDDLHARLMSQVAHCHELEMADAMLQPAGRVRDSLVSSLNSRRREDMNRLSRERETRLLSSITEVSPKSQTQHSDSNATSDDGEDEVDDVGGEIKPRPWATRATAGAGSSAARKCGGRGEDISGIELDRSGSGFEFIEVTIDDLPDAKMKFGRGGGVQVSERFAAEARDKATQEREAFEVEQLRKVSPQFGTVVGEDYVDPKGFDQDREAPLTEQQRRDLARLGIVLSGGQGRGGGGGGGGKGGGQDVATADEDMPTTVSYAGSSSSARSDDEFELETGDQ